MRVLQVVPAMDVGGVETGTLDLARELVLRGHRAYVVSSGGSLVSELVKAGVQHVTLPVKSKSLWALRAVSKLRQLIEREQIDIVHARSRIPAFIAYLATRRTRAAFVTTCHGFYSHHPLSYVMGWGRRVIVTSTVIGRRMLDTFGVDLSRIVLVHRGVDLTQFSFYAGKYIDRKQKKFVVACVGRISPIKGIDDFIKAVAILSRKHSEVEAWIVGEEGKKDKSYTEKLKQLVERLGLSDVVKFLGLRRDIPELLNQIDVLAMPTRIPESFGRVVAEAGAAGTAVVATRLGGALDVIDEGVNGLFISPGNPSELAEAMEQLIESPELADSLSRKLREKVEREFSLEKMVNATLEVYREALKDQRILIIKLGALGDIVLATPSFHMVRKRYPQAYIALLVDRRFREVVDRCPYLNQVISIDRHGAWQTVSGLFKLVRRLRRCGFDLSIDLQNTAKTHVLAMLAGIPVRVGYRRKWWLNRMLTHGVGGFGDALPPVQHQFRVLKSAHIHDFDDEMELWPSEEAGAFIEKRLAEEWLSGSEQLVGFVLGASQRWVTKQWPLAYFSELARRVHSNLGARVVLIGDQRDRSLADEFRKLSNEPVIDLVGATDLDQLTVLVRRLNVLVTGDSAPMHIAAAVKAPLIAIFGPTDPKRHVPSGTGHHVFFKQVSCAPCYQTYCNVGHICMLRVSVEEVFEAVRSHLLVREHPVVA